MALPWASCSAIDLQSCLFVPAGSPRVPSNRASGLCLAELRSTSSLHACAGGRARHVSASPVLPPAPSETSSQQLGLPDPTGGPLGLILQAEPCMAVAGTQCSIPEGRHESAAMDQGCLQGVQLAAKAAVWTCQVSTCSLPAPLLGCSPILCGAVCGSIPGRSPASLAWGCRDWQACPWQPLSAPACCCQHQRLAPRPVLHKGAEAWAVGGGQAGNSGLLSCLAPSHSCGSQLSQELQQERIPEACVGLCQTGLGCSQGSLHQWPWQTQIPGCGSLSQPWLGCCEGGNPGHCRPLSLPTPWPLEAVGMTALLSCHAQAQAAKIACIRHSSHTHLWHHA